MMEKREIIKEWASNREVERIIEKVIRQPLYDYYQDLANDIYLALLEKDEKLIQGLQDTNSFRFWIAKMVMNNIASNRSPFHTTYRKPRQECKEEIETKETDEIEHKRH